VLRRPKRVARRRYFCMVSSYFALASRFENSSLEACWRSHLAPRTITASGEWCSLECC